MAWPCCVGWLAWGLAGALASGGFAPSPQVQQRPEGLLGAPGGDAEPARGGDETSRVGQQGGPARCGPYWIRGRAARVLPIGIEQVTGAALTPCDCGSQQAPSFVLRAPYLVLSPQRRRANVWWPRLQVRPWGSRRLFTVTPPLLPISLPLTERAAGALPPQLQFLAPPWPTLDIPFFFPLGDGADLTVTLGTRSDWRGAPRASARVRAHPRPNVLAEAKLEDTWDYAHRMAARRAARELGMAPQLAQNPVWQDIDAQRRRLGHRLRAAAHGSWRSVQPLAQAGRPAQSSSSVQADGLWISDDLVLRDLSVLPAERSAAYLANRAVLSLQRPWMVVSIASDLMQNLLSVQRVGNSFRPELRNGAAEGRTLHRVPAVRASVVAPVGRLLVAQSEIALSRYGAMTASPAGSLGPPMHAVSASVGLGVAARKKMVALSAMVFADALLLAQTDLGAYAQLAPRASARAHTTLARRAGGLLHEVTPYVEVRGMRVPHAGGATRAAFALRGLDEFAAQATRLQAAAGVSQSLWATDANAIAPLLRADASAAYDVLSREAMQSTLSVEASKQALGQLRFTLGVAPPRTNFNLGLREVDVAYAQQMGWLTVSAAYVRLAPNAERLVRTLYDLRGPDQSADPDAPWLHTLRTGYQVSLWQRITSSAMVSFQLPRPATAQDRGLVLPVSRARSLDRVTVSSLSVRTGYRSPCSCWGADVYFSAAPRDFFGSLRVLVSVEVGPYRMGAL